MKNILQSIENIKFLDSGNFFLMAGPCVVENEKIAFDTAEAILEISEKYKIPFIYKSSFRKANRSRGSRVGHIRHLQRQLFACQRQNELQPCFFPSAFIVPPFICTAIRPSKCTPPLPCFSNSALPV